MLAYVFWHQPSSDAVGYEEALTRFHHALTTSPTPGLNGSRSVGVPSLPWLPDGGFEDWYYVEDFASLGLLNAGAVLLGAHETIARLSAAGTGGLYAVRSGPWSTVGARHAWSASLPILSAAAGSVWQRQMVLGPAPEYCWVGDEARGDLTVDVSTITAFTG